MSGVFDYRGPHTWAQPGLQRCPRHPEKPESMITPCAACGWSKGCCMGNTNQCSANKGGGGVPGLILKGFFLK